MAYKQQMDFDDIFQAYYTLFRADSDVPTSTDDEYTIGMRMANEAINYWANYEGTYWNELFSTNQDDGSGSQTITTGNNIYSAPTNFREAAGNVSLLDANDNEIECYPIVDLKNVQFTIGTYCYFTSSPVFYSTGTASQSTTTITGVGTTWTADMVGMEFNFATGESATITAFGGPTSLTVSVSQTVTSTTYQIVDRGYKLHLSPTPNSDLNGLKIQYSYYKNPTYFTDGKSTTEMANPYFVVHRMLAQQFRAARNPYYSSALRDAENTIRLMQLDNNSGNWANPPVLSDISGMSWGN